MGKLYVITGPAGVGKTTISKLISEDSKKSALIEGDEIYHFVKGGYVSPWLPGNQLDIFWDNSFDIVENFLKKDYDVVFNYIIYKNDLERIKNRFKDVEIKFIVLMVDENTIVKRDRMRPLDCQMGDRSLVLLNEFKEQGYNKNNILDTSNLSIEECVNVILYDNRFTV